jgi:hypothetical protein
MIPFTGMRRSGALGLAWEAGSASIGAASSRSGCSSVPATGTSASCSAAPTGRCCVPIGVPRRLAPIRDDAGLRRITLRSETSVTRARHWPWSHHYSVGGTQQPLGLASIDSQLRGGPIAHLSPTSSIS